MNSIFKIWLRNSDIIQLLAITVIFWSMVVAALSQTDILLSLSYSFQDDFFGGLMAFFGCLIVTVLSVAIPIYLIKSWIKFKNTGKW